MFLLFVFLTVYNYNYAQFSFTIPMSAGDVFDKSILDKPVKLVVHNFEKASENEKQKMVDIIKKVGFTDTILINTPHKYATTKYRDSVNNICNQIGVKTQIDISFSIITYNFSLFFENQHFGTLIEMHAYNSSTGKTEKPQASFGAENVNKLVKMIKKRIN
jgi:hypothetical protein